jgi:hypothetical protein
MKSTECGFSDETTTKLFGLLNDIEAELQLRGLEPDSKPNLN